MASNNVRTYFIIDLNRLSTRGVIHMDISAFLNVNHLHSFLVIDSQAAVYRVKDLRMTSINSTKGALN